MKFKKLMLNIVIPVIIIILGITYFVQKNQTKPLPVLGEIQEFELIDSHEEIISHKNMTGKVWVTNFIFTSCAHVCPMMTSNMKKVHRLFEGQENIDFVSVSVDPEKDTPQVLKKYAQKHNAHAKNWHFLTGEREKIKQLMFEQFKLGFAEDVIFHSERVVLVDRHAKIRGYYNGTNGNEYNKLRKDISLLLKEK